MRTAAGRWPVDLREQAGRVAGPIMMAVRVLAVVTAGGLTGALLGDATTQDIGTTSSGAAGNVVAP